jgi:hypothetical protein
MKKILLSILLGYCLSATVSFAQNTTETFANKDNVVGAGFGIGGVYGFSDYSAQTPVFGAFYERGIYEFGFGGVIGVGGYMGYKGYVSKINYSSNEDWKVRSRIFILGARGTFHYDLFKVDKLDTYGAVMITYHIVNESDDIPDAFDPYYTHDNHGNAAYASLHAGARYYFTPSFGAYAEVGYGVYWLGMGVAFKF